MLWKNAKIITIVCVGALALAACSGGETTAHNNSQPHWNSWGFDGAGGDA